MEFRFELALCRWLETHTDRLVARQLGGAVAAPGSRIVDVCLLEPGPAFDRRTAITPEAIPLAAIESDVGLGTAVRPRAAFDCHPDRARSVTDRAIDIGFFEAERRGGRRYVRQATRYPQHWFERLVAIENKPDLGRPGDLERQLRLDVSLALFDEVILATESYVTGAHLNRIPPEVGVWRFDPDTRELTVIREPASLSVEEPGIEPIAYNPLSTEIETVMPDAKRRKRLRIAERAYGKGWRTYDMPGCEHAEATAAGLPYCAAYDRIVDPATNCGSGCPRHEPAEPPGVALSALRNDRSPWVRDPDGVVRQQTGL
ncbi:MAG: DUF5787 family protein, partial [Natrialbaceae archaeon]